MGLKCRLLGHAYGNPEVERSREEQGDEVVVTVRNVRICERCGDERMVNQTREVTAVRSPDEVGLETTEPSSAAAEPAGRSAGDIPETAPSEADVTDSPVTPVEPESAGSAGPDPEASPGTEGESTPDAGVDDGDEPAVEPATDRIDDGVVADATVSAPGKQDGPAGDRDGPDVGGGAAADAGNDAEAGTGVNGGWETGSDEWDDVDADPDIDDAVILDAEETDHDEVQWPGASETDPEGDTATGRAANEEGATRSWPDHDDADEGYAATPNGDVETEFGGEGLTPEVNGSAAPDSAGVDGITVRGSDGHAAGASQVGGDDTTPETDTGTGEGFVRAAESGHSGSDVPDGRVEFYCPNCGYEGTVGASSMRAGDICPECKRGYIAERES